LSWQHVRGREELIDGYRRAAARGRLAHAYLFVGPPGVGKSFFARELAKTLLCESRSADGFEACDRCPACKLVDAGTHPDLFAVGRPDEKQEFPIEVIRELCANLSMKPARGRRKIAIVEDADDFNDQSANCFLKTLEEPPPGSILILIATSAEMQLPTIRSRCQVVRFGPLAQQTVRELLTNDSELDAEAVSRLTRLAGTGVSRVRELADAELWKLRDSLFSALIQERPDGPALAAAVREWVEAAGKDSGAQRRRVSALVQLVTDGLRQALSLSLGGPPASAVDDALMNSVASLGPEGLLARLDCCLTTEMHVDRRVQLVLAVEGFIDALLYQAPQHASP
jgi:DNA polymerase-3 subunit delta'